jgi:shikimate kinase
MKRAKPENRPLLKNNFNLDFVRNLISERKNFYAESSDIVVDTNEKSIQEVVQTILLEIESLN